MSKVNFTEKVREGLRIIISRSPTVLAADYGYLDPTDNNEEIAAAIRYAEQEFGVRRNDSDSVEE
tara:strand:+ start:777 stop:971 length:195 start_codon:yes stop_codon:yes gene_type:complete